MSGKLGSRNVVIIHESLTSRPSALEIDDILHFFLFILHVVATSRIFLEILVSACIDLLLC